LVFCGLCYKLHATSDPETSGGKVKVPIIGVLPIHATLNPCPLGRIPQHTLFSSNGGKKASEKSAKCETPRETRRPRRATPGAATIRTNDLERRNTLHPLHLPPCAPCLRGDFGPPATPPSPLRLQQSPDRRLRRRQLEHDQALRGRHPCRHLLQAHGAGKRQFGQRRPRLRHANKSAKKRKRM
jgi:hypothetical protein